MTLFALKRKNYDFQAKFDKLVRTRRMPISDYGKYSKYHNTTVYVTIQLNYLGYMITPYEQKNIRFTHARH